MATPDGRLAPLRRRMAGRTAPRSAPSVAYGFSGHVENPIGSGTGLYHEEPAFRESVDAMSALMAPSIGLEVAGVFAHPDSESSVRFAESYLGSRRYQAAFQVGLVDLWSARGLRPGAVIGLSLGEYVGAYAAGIIDRPDLARILNATFGHFEAARRPGVLWAVDDSADRLAAMVADAPVTVYLVGIMTRHNAIVICAEADADRARDHLHRSTNVLSEHPRADLSWHTPLSEQADAAFLREIADLTYRPAACPVYAASLGGARIDRGVAPDPRFFVGISQSSFVFEASAAAAIADGHRLLVGSPTVGRLMNDVAARERRDSVHVIDAFNDDEPVTRVLARAHRELESLGVLP